MAYRGQSTLRTALHNSTFDVDGIAIFRNLHSVGNKPWASLSVGEPPLHHHTIHGSSIYRLNGFQPCWMRCRMALSNRQETMKFRLNTRIKQTLGYVSKEPPKGGVLPRWTNCNQNRFLRSVKFQRLSSTSNLRSRFLRTPFPKVGH